MFELKFIGKKYNYGEEVGYQPYDLATTITFGEDVTATDAIDCFLRLLEIASFNPEVINNGLRKIMEIRGVEDKNCQN